MKWIIIPLAAVLAAAAFLAFQLRRPSPSDLVRNVIAHSGDARAWAKVGETKAIQGVDAETAKRAIRAAIVAMRSFSNSDHQIVVLLAIQWVPEGMEADRTPAYMAAVGSMDPTVRALTLNGLKDCGSASRDAVCTILSKDVSAFWKVGALDIAASTSTDGEGMVECLAAALETADLELTVAILATLDDWGPNAAKAIPEIVHVAAKDHVVRRAAVKVLGNVVTEPGEGLEVVRSYLVDDDYVVRLRAVAALGHVCTRLRGELPLLIKCAGDSKPEVRALVAKELGANCHGETDIVNALTKLSSDDDEKVRAAADQALFDCRTAK